MRSLVFGLVVLISPVVAAQAQIERPELRVGDSWTYHDSSLNGSFSWTREIVGRDGDNYIARYTRDDNPKTVEQPLTRDLNRVRKAGGRTTVSDWFSFPLVQGKSWKSEEVWPDGHGYVEVIYTVVGREMVSVKAGNLDTVKLVGKGRWHDTETNKSDVVEIEIWYAPSVRAIARYHERRWLRGNVGLDTTDELVSYKQGGS